MSTPLELDLIKSGIDTVIKIQTKNGRLTFQDVAPVINTKEGFYKAATITGFGDAGIFGRGVAVPSDRKLKQYETSYYPFRYAKAWEYDIYSKDEDVYNEMADNASDIALSMRRRKNKEAANLFNNGFDDTNYPGYDGHALFYNTHPGVGGVTGSNRPATFNTPSPFAVENAIAQYMSQTDPRGESMEFEGNLEVQVGNILFPQMTRIIKADGLSGTNDKDPNFAKDYVTVYRNDKITTSTGMHFKAKNMEEHGLRTIQFSPYRIATQDEARTEQTVCVVSERYRMIWLRWQGTFGDPGA